MTGIEALEYLRTHRYAAIRCKAWPEDVCISASISGLDCTWARYYHDGIFENAVDEHIPDEDMTVQTIFTNFFDELFTKEWEIVTAPSCFTFPPVKCGWNEYYDPRYPDERFPEAE